MLTFASVQCCGVAIVMHAGDPVTDKAAILAQYGASLNACGVCTERGAADLTVQQCLHTDVWTQDASKLCGLVRLAS